MRARHLRFTNYEDSSRLWILSQTGFTFAASQRLVRDRPPCSHDSLSFQKLPFVLAINDLLPSCLCSLLVHPSGDPAGSLGCWTSSPQPILNDTCPQAHGAFDSEPCACAAVDTDLVGKVYENPAPSLGFLSVCSAVGRRLVRLCPSSLSLLL